jgi:hypothetical protein
VSANNLEIQNKLDEKNCPFCAEKIKSSAVKCKHCGSNLPIKVSGSNEWMKYTPIGKHTRRANMTGEDRRFMRWFWFWFFAIPFLLLLITKLFE